MHTKRTAAGTPDVLSWQQHASAVGNLGFAVLMAAMCLFVSPNGHAAELLTYTVAAKGGRWVPEVLNVPARVRFKIVVRNDGPGAIEFESLELRKEKVLAEGAQSFVVIAPLRPGEYPFFDDFHPDTGRGRIVAK